MTGRFIILILAVFAALSGAFFMLHNAQPAYGLEALMGGNILMAVLSLATYFIVNRQISERPQAFVGGVYGATFLKLLVCVVAIIAYALFNKAHLHKPTLFILFGIYIIYTAAETILLMKMAKRVK